MEAQVLKQSWILPELLDPLKLFSRDVEAAISDMKRPWFNTKQLEGTTKGDARYAKLSLGNLERHKVRLLGKDLRILLHILPNFRTA